MVYTRELYDPFITHIYHYSTSISQVLQKMVYFMLNLDQEIDDISKLILCFASNQGKLLIY